MLCEETVMVTVVDTTIALPFMTHSVTHHREAHSFFLFFFDSKTFDTSSFFSHPD